MRDALEGRQHVERYTQALAHEVKAPLAAIRGAGIDRAVIAAIGSAPSWEPRR